MAMMGDAAADILALADWRRRIAELYATVRNLAAVDVPSALALWRGVREDLYREHTQSPVPLERRPDFRALHFPYEPSLRFEVGVVADEALALELPVSVGSEMTFRRVGWVGVPFPAGSRRLALYWTEGYGGGLFLPFRDATNGVETYCAGRYLLDGAKGADLGGDAARATLILDFNFAYQPSCAFDPRWACPLAPPENRLDIPIHAGERIG